MCIRDRYMGQEKSFNQRSLTDLDGGNNLLHQRLCFQFEGRNRRGSQLVYEFRISFHKLRSAYRVLVVFYDLTDRLQNLELKKASEYKTRLMASVSHELRTPLNGNMNFLQMALEDARIPGETKEKLLSPALNCSEYLLCIVNDILDYSTMHDYSEAKMIKEEFEVREMIEETTQLISLQAKLRGLSLQSRVDERIPRLINHDRNRLKRIIMNLLSNSLKYTLTGFIHLILEFDPLNKVLQFIVEDSGIGMSEQNLVKVRNLLGEEDILSTPSPNNSSPTGMGLGLTLSGCLAKMLDLPSGIRVDSRQGEGSRFWFEVPYEEPDANEYVEYTIPSEHTQHLLRKKSRVSVPVLTSSPSNWLLATQKRRGADLDGVPTMLSTMKEVRCGCSRVLVVDDSDFNREVLKKMLKTLGIDSEEAMHGQAAVDIVEKQWRDRRCGCEKPFRIILMDIDMPVMDGRAATIELRQKMIKGELPYIPIVACTAFAFKTELDKCIECGMDDYLCKPLSKAMLRQALDAWYFKD
eukprot:TRINITY_DN7827_c0_g1_i1.p1 TRINITY_DN7827_c0_g1~~TRINITY_DN7827_c0_g1_i1.p1  ORF type:complete len:538 (-),score=72.01 TRINITY_DN7827_c0_g1_i1:149-1717(-)